ncbi:MAG: polysaccharide pyruvyl transferase family protein, partial [Chlorobi bacterium]|nr:polysaccharide pyruvyl transferase family protein [Chlorobiota bacterium]
NICHLNSDARFELCLDGNNVKYKTVLLNYKTPSEVYKFYNNMELVMGMRGHAQMIPFGLNCHIISLGTHDKMRWFLEDIDATEWYINLLENPEELDKTILEKFEKEYENNKINARKKLIEKQDYLFKVTENNMKKINDIL